MLILCCGPESFLAKNKSKELVDAYRAKHVAQGAVIENLDHLEEPTKDALSRLANIGLFATKRLLKYSNLFSSSSASQLKQLSRLIATDDDQTVILSHENKKPTEKNLSVFPKEKIFVYAFEELNGKELDCWFTERCRHYSLKQKPIKLLETFGNDLWSIDTALQILRVAESADFIDEKADELRVFDIIDKYFSDRKTWKSHASNTDPQELLPLLVSQVLNWQKINAGHGENIHPYVAKKLSYTKFNDAATETLSVLRALYGSRTSLTQSEEILQVI